MHLHVTLLPRLHVTLVSREFMTVGLDSLQWQLTVEILLVVVFYPLIADKTL